MNSYENNKLVDSNYDLTSIKEKEFLTLLEGFIEGYGYTLIPEVFFGGYTVSGYIPELNVVIEYMEKDKEYPATKCKMREKEIKAELCSNPLCEEDCHFIYVSDKFAHSFNLGIIALELQKIDPYVETSKNTGMPEDIKYEILGNFI